MMKVYDSKVVGIRERKFFDENAPNKEKVMYQVCATVNDPFWSWADFWSAKPYKLGDTVKTTFYNKKWHVFEQ